MWIKALSKISLNSLPPTVVYDNGWGKLLSSIMKHGLINGFYENKDNDIITDTSGKYVLCADYIIINMFNHKRYLVTTPHVKAEIKKKKLEFIELISWDKRKLKKGI